MLKIILKLCYKKKSSYFLMFILFVLFLFLLILSNFSFIIFNYIHNMTTKSFENRILLITDYKEMGIDNLLAVDHVTEVINYNDFNHYLKVGKDNFIQLYSISKEELKNINIIEGNNNLKGNNLICPYEFVPLQIDKYSKEELNNNTFYPKTYLNKEFNVKFEKKKILGPFDKDIVNSKTEKFKIVGSYNNKAYGLENNICFVEQDKVKDIRNYETYDLEKKEQEDAGVYAVIVDSIKNNEKVEKDIKNMGYSIQHRINFDVKSITILSSIAIFIYIVIIIVISKVINLSIKMNLSSKENEILLYKSIGYTNKKIVLINLIEYFIVILTSIILSFLISYVVFYMIRNYLSLDMSYQLLDIKMYYLPNIIVLFAGIAYNLFILYYKTNKIVNRKKISI